MTKEPLQWQWGLRTNCTDPPCYRMRESNRPHSDHGLISTVCVSEGHAINVARQKTGSNNHYYEVVCRPVYDDGAIGEWQKPDKPSRKIKEVPL